MPIERDPLFNGKGLMTIKEFAAFSGVEQTTLRYWDDIGLISPAERNPDNNYRYYSPLQQSTVNFVNLLSSLNVPLKTIGEMKDQRSPDSILKLLERQEILLDMEMHRLRESHTIIHRLRGVIQAGLEADPDDISVQRLETANYILGPRNEWGEEPSFFETFLRFCKEAPHLRINLNYSIGGLHESMEGFMRAPGQPDYYFSIDPTGYEERPGGNYLVGYARGYYGEFGGLPQRMAAYAEEHNLVLSGPVRVIYLHDEICMQQQDQYLARVIVAAGRGKRKAGQPKWEVVG
ncbi:MAG: MerR family DNA-binding transcriptional regulator [Firmicutes bacterium]|nr:MerR family DNA-binding transcriptional regulator [Bacillota bacterium]